MYSTLNISANEIRLLVANKKGVQYWSGKELPSGWIKDGRILEPEQVGATIESLFKSAKIYPTDVTICVTGLPFTYRIVKLPPMKQSLVRDSIKHFMSKETSMPTEQMYWSWAMLEESDDEVTYLVLGVDQQIVNAVAETMREAKIRHWTMDLKSIALARAASPDNAIVVSAESDCYDIVLVEDGNVSTMHTVSIGEATYDNMEHAKQLAVEISKAVAYDDKRRGQSLPEKGKTLLMTGGISCDEDVKDFIQTELGYPVKPLTPTLPLQPDLPVHLYSTNIGLALKYIHNSGPVLQNAIPYNDIDLDIMTGRYTKPSGGLSLTYLISTILLVVVIGLMVPIDKASVDYYAESSRLRNELGTVNHQLQEARLSYEKAGETESRTNYVYSQLGSLRTGREALLGSQGAFAVNLEKVVDALPAQSYFTNLQLLPQQITVRGHADDVFQIVDYTAILEQKGLPSNIRISEIGEASEDEGVTFEVVITR